MTTQNTSSENTKSKPTHIIRKKFWNGKRTDFETLGVAWETDKGGLYIKLHGTQIIDGGFYAFPNRDKNINHESGQ